MIKFELLNYQSTLKLSTGRTESGIPEKPKLENFNETWKMDGLNPKIIYVHGVKDPSSTFEVQLMNNKTKYLLKMEI